MGRADFSNFCIRNIAYVDPYYGHIAGSGSFTTPEYIPGTSVLYYEMKWDAIGDMFLRLGDTGETKLIDTDKVFIFDNEHKMRGRFIWSDVTLQYERFDLAWVDKLIADLEDPTCFFITPELNPYEIINRTNDIFNGTNNIVNDRI